MRIAKYLLIGAGVLVALFIGSAVVVGALEGLGVIAPSGDGGRSSDDEDPGRKGGAARDRSGRPLLRVTRVIDGDTVVTNKFKRVRLIGVDTPEEGRCGDNSATRFTRQRLEGNRVGYELGAERRDRYGRTLAYLFPNEEMHEMALLNRGLARILTIAPNDNYEAQFRRAERDARGGGRGVWGVCRERAAAARRAKELRRQRAAALRRERAAAARRVRREAAAASRRVRQQAAAAERRARRQSRSRRPSPSSSGGGSGGGGSGGFACGPGDIDGDNDGRCNE